MSSYLLAAFVLLAAMVYLILRPFLVPSGDAVGAPEALDVDESVPGPVDAAPDASDAATGDVRATVEAAIAARKAALTARHCAACDGVIDGSDAFCRSCGTAVPVPSLP